MPCVYGIKSKLNQCINFMKEVISYALLMHLVLIIKHI